MATNKKLKERQKADMKALTAAEKETRRRMLTWYGEQADQLEREIADYALRYGKNGIIEYRDLLARADSRQLKTLRTRFKAFSEKHPEYAHLLPIADTITDLNRLEALEYSIRIQQHELGWIEDRELTKHLQYVQRLGFDSARDTLGGGVDMSIVRDYVRTPWADGLTFSDRIWANREQMTRYLTDQISSGFARGDSVQRIAKEMRKSFVDVSKHSIDRLIYTEGTRVYAEATSETFRAAGITRYQLSTVGDDKVCPACRELQQQVFEYSAREPGVNFPPLHPWCRCTTDPYVEDWDAYISGKA